MDEAVTEFGIVQIVSGRHKGKFGCYDDDGERGRAIVYTGFPVLTDDYFEVDKRHMRPATSEQIAEYERICSVQYAQMKLVRIQYCP